MPARTCGKSIVLTLCAPTSCRVKALIGMPCLLFDTTQNCVVSLSAHFSPAERSENIGGKSSRCRYEIHCDSAADSDPPPILAPPNKQPCRKSVDWNVGTRCSENGSSKSLIDRSRQTPRGIGMKVVSSTKNCNESARLDQKKVSNPRRSENIWAQTKRIEFSAACQQGSAAQSSNRHPWFR